MRLLLLAAAILTPTAAHTQAPKLPPYEHPATVADAAGIPVGAPGAVRGEEVCYGRDTHRRLAYMLAAVEPLSDTRATQAWAMGYRDGRMTTVGELDAERERRVKAEADLAKTSARPGIAPYIAAAGAGLAAGIILGVLVGGL